MIERSELIARLAEDLEGTPPTLSLMNRLASWLAIVVIALVTGVLVVGMRGDFSQIFMTPRFTVEGFAIILAGISSGVLALVLAEPGRSTRPATITALTALIVWGLSVYAALILQFDALASMSYLNTKGFGCSREILAFALVPALVLVGLIRMGSAVHGRLAGGLLLLSAGFFGMFAMQFICANDGPLHLMAYHVVPVVLLGGIGWCTGKWLCGFEARLEEKKKKILE